MITATIAAAAAERIQVESHRSAAGQASIRALPEAGATRRSQPDTLLKPLGRREPGNQPQRVFKVAGTGAAGSRVLSVEFIANSLSQ